MMYTPQLVSELNVRKMFTIAWTWASYLLCGRWSPEARWLLCAWSWSCVRPWRVMSWSGQGMSVWCRQLPYSSVDSYQAGMWAIPYDYSRKKQEIWISMKKFRGTDMLWVKQSTSTGCIGAHGHQVGGFALYFFEAELLYVNSVPQSCVGYSHVWWP